MRHQAAGSDQRLCVRVALVQGGFAGLGAAAHDFGCPGNPGRAGVATRCRAAMVQHWVFGKECQRHMGGNAVAARVY